MLEEELLRLTEDRLLLLLLRLTDDLFEEEDLLRMELLFESWLVPLLKKPFIRLKKVALSCLLEFKFTFRALSNVLRSSEEDFFNDF